MEEDTGDGATETFSLETDLMPIAGGEDLDDQPFRLHGVGATELIGLLESDYPVDVTVQWLTIDYEAIGDPITLGIDTTAETIAEAVVSPHLEVEVTADTRALVSDGFHLR